MTTNQAPSPLAINPSRGWDGNDGFWSSFELGIGTPPQYVRVLVSTTAGQAWVVLPEGCTPQDPPNCAFNRGGLLYINGSSTWQDKGLYTLLFEQNLGFEGNGEFGLDTLTLGLPGTGAPAVTHQVVAGVATKDFYIGTLGLGPHATNLTTLNDPQKSLMSTLKEQRLIPSMSWAYTAGAHYRLKGAVGDLILGGYSASRFQPSNVTFNFAADRFRDIVVSIQSISANSKDSASVNLLPNAILSFIDAGVSHIWLPLESCRAFESAFGLVFDTTTELYLVNDTLHNSLLARNASITFVLGNYLGSSTSETVNITLPYASFDLELTTNYPGIANATRYFPIKRAANDSQNTLGRTFLQEAYLIADHERSTFSINQCIFSETTHPDVKTIYPLNSSNITSPTAAPPALGEHSPPALTTPMIAGIVTSAVAIIIIFSASIFFNIQKRRRQKRLNQASSTNVLDKAELPNVEKPTVVIGELHEDPQRHEVGDPKALDAELPGSEGPPAAQLPDSQMVYELMSQRVHELPGAPFPEVEGRTVERGGR